MGFGEFLVSKGAITMEGLAFPEYRGHYLNLALNSSSVFGMAISNARAYQSLETAKDSAEKATRLKDKFLSLVAHDLKGPLATMIGFLQLARDGAGAAMPETARKTLDLAIGSGTQMIGLLNDLLKVSRFKTGQPRLNKQFFDAKYLGAKMAADYSGLAEQKGIEMANDIPENSRIYADRMLLSEAVQNLVNNAIKFCSRGDHITLVMAENDPTTLCVRDTGPGIRPDALEKLFKYEEKTSTPGTAGEVGTGFGLPLTKDIMEFHGGELGVKSEPGKGSVFSLKLPFVRPKILVVDDDNDFRLMMSAYLKIMDVEILEAKNGREALEVISSRRPHLVISDLKLPVLDGLELLRLLKADLNTRDIPVFVVSGEYGMEIRNTVFKLGADEFVTKGKIDRIDFIPRVRRFVG